MSRTEFKNAYKLEKQGDDMYWVIKMCVLFVRGPPLEIFAR